MTNVQTDAAPPHGGVPYEQRRSQRERDKARAFKAHRGEGSEPAALVAGAGEDKAERPPAAAKRAAVPAPVRVRVTFEELTEWLQEIEEAADQVDRRVVRFTIRYEPPGEGYGLRTVALVAGAVVGGEILELVAKAGTVFGDNGEGDQAANGRIERWRTQLMEMCEKVGLTLKAGRFGAV